MKKFFMLLVPFFIWGCTTEVFELPQKDKSPIDSTVVDRCDTLDITYQNRVKKIIDDNCIACHDPNSANGDFTNFNSLKPKLESGFFRSRVIFDKNMPPSGPLPQSELDDLSCWLDNNFPEN